MWHVASLAGTEAFIFEAPSQFPPPPARRGAESPQTRQADRLLAAAPAGGLCAISMR
jgi:hypothetical protein